MEHQNNMKDDDIEGNPELKAILQSEGLRSQHGDALYADKEFVKTLPLRFDSSSVSIKPPVKWFAGLLLAGIGMFIEAYVIITTGQMKTIWTAEYPQCWDMYKKQHCPKNIQCCHLHANTPVVNSTKINGTVVNGTCAATLKPAGFCVGSNNTYPTSLQCGHRTKNAVSYSSFAGIMAGMSTFGFLTDMIGRKAAGGLSSVIMFSGIAGMTLWNSPESTKDVFVGFSAFLGLFGLGVGGEYPLTASYGASHNSFDMALALKKHPDATDAERFSLLTETTNTLRRGETMSMVFAFQGVGAVFGSMVLLILIYLSDQMRVDCTQIGANTYGNIPAALEGIWRGFYFIGLFMIAMMLAYRWLIVPEQEGYEEMKARQKARADRLGVSVAGLKMKVLGFYFFRIMGTGGSWMLMDVAFYGLKLFSGPIFKAINPGGNLVVQNGWLAFNNICALFGYYGCAKLVDIPGIGRWRLQCFSFVAAAIVFAITGAIFHQTKYEVLMFLYFFSSFLINFGANVSTYVMAGETYPLECRGTCHGLSAFMGKTGALAATIAFNYMTVQDIFYTCAAAMVGGLVFTFLFGCDMTHVSLAEHDAQMELWFEGKLHLYKGKLNAPEHLSYFELWMGRQGEYDPEWLTKLNVEEKKLVTENVSTE